MNISDYQTQLCETLLNTSFEQQSSVSGGDILQLTPEKQINMFVLFLLMNAWKEQMDASKSPYFNYRSEEVAEAQKAYMNTLSRHIEISREDFEPLLSKAITYTFELAKNPESFVVTNHLEGKLSDLKKYIQYHKPYFEGESGYDAEDKTDEVLNKLSAVLPMAEEPETQPETETPVQEAPVVEDTPPQPEVKEEEQPEETPAPEPVAQKINQPLSTINDRFTDTTKTTNEVKLMKIDSIKAAITLNQRFRFVKELFDGNEEQYNATIQRLDNCNNGSEALQILRETADDDGEEELVESLELLIQQKYHPTAK